MTKGISRRGFLGAGGAALAILGCDAAASRPPKPRVVAALDQVPAGLSGYPLHRVALLRNGDALRAFSMVCTHFECGLNVTPSGFVCPCHGAEFSPGGKVLRGPAERPLQEFKVWLDQGAVWVDPGTVVGKSAPTETP